MTHYFSRIVLTKQGLESRIRDTSYNSYDIHKEVWGLFPGMPDSNRDFVYSIMDDGRTIYMVSSREPLFNDHWMVESKEYDPKINPGDVFRFRLLANPTVMKTKDNKHKRHDVVMDLKQKLRAEGKEFDMNSIVNSSVSDWVERKASLNGFKVDHKSLMIHSYTSNKSQKGDRKIIFSTAIIEGVLMVTDVESFKNCLFKGIGSAKGFGCGMLMIKHV